MPPPVPGPYATSRKLPAFFDPVGTARKLLGAPAVSDGFAALWERGRLDLTVESLVLEPQFAELFDDSELENARRRLEQFGYARTSSTTDLHGGGESEARS